MSYRPLSAEATQRVEFVKHFIRWGLGGWFTDREGERDYFRDALWTIENVVPHEWDCCPLCQEVVCDDDCPLYVVRDEAGIWIGSKGDPSARHADDGT